MTGEQIKDIPIAFDDKRRIRMNLIVAVDKNWAIGNKGELLVRIPADHKMFRQETTGKVVVLGRKTMDTFPGGQPSKPG